MYKSLMLKKVDYTQAVIMSVLLRGKAFQEMNLKINYGFWHKHGNYFELPGMAGINSLCTSC